MDTSTNVNMAFETISFKLEVFHWTDKKLKTSIWEVDCIVVYFCPITCHNLQRDAMFCLCWRHPVHQYVACVARTWTDVLSIVCYRFPFTSNRQWIVFI